MEWFTYQLEVVGAGPRVQETRPSSCPNGHPLTGGRCIIGMAEIDTGERVRSWECRSCGAVIYGRRD